MNKGNLEADLTPPTIAPVPRGIKRPLWSVMIPTFNCAKYLRQTLESVLVQDPGLEQMQIEVIDDCSTLDDPEAVVQELGKGRVLFYRQPQNGGAIANFNTCIARSRGQLVHILHGDDWVLPGFYAAIKSQVDKYPGQGALFASRVFFAGEDGYYTGVTKRVPEFENQICRDLSAFWFGTPLQFAGVVVRRSFYEEYGGFDPGLIHTADWEMWVRAVESEGGVILPDTLAAYRVFSGNDTGRLMRTAENLVDRERLTLRMVRRHKNFPLQDAMNNLLNASIEQERTFAALGDLESAKANRNFWSRRASATTKAKRYIKKILSIIIGRQDKF